MAGRQAGKDDSPVRHGSGWNWFWMSKDASEYFGNCLLHAKPAQGSGGLCVILGVVVIVTSLGAAGNLNYHVSLAVGSAVSWHQMWWHIPEIVAHRLEGWVITNYKHRKWSLYLSCMHAHFAWEWHGLYLLHFIARLFTFLSSTLTYTYICQKQMTLHAFKVKSSARINCGLYAASKHLLYFCSQLCNGVILAGS